MKSNQQGVVLIISLILLLVISIVVLSSGKTTVLQNKMTSAVIDTQVSLNTVEQAFKDAGDFIDDLKFRHIDGGTSIFTAIGTDGLYSTANEPSYIFDASWGVDSSGDSLLYMTSSPVHNIKAEYYIVYMGPSSADQDKSSSVEIINYGATGEDQALHIFKVVARATGRTGKAERIATALYGARL